MPTASHEFIRSKRERNELGECGNGCHHSRDSDRVSDLRFDRDEKNSDNMLKDVATKTEPVPVTPTCSRTEPTRMEPEVNCSDHGQELFRDGDCNEEECCFLVLALAYRHDGTTSLSTPGRPTKCEGYCYSCVINRGNKSTSAFMKREVVLRCTNRACRRAIHLRCADQESLPFKIPDALLQNTVGFSASELDDIRKKYEIPIEFGLPKPFDSRQEIRPALLPQPEGLEYSSTKEKTEKDTTE